MGTISAPGVFSILSSSYFFKLCDILSLIVTMIVFYFRAKKELCSKFKTKHAKKPRNFSHITSGNVFLKLFWFDSLQIFLSLLSV